MRSALGTAQAIGGLILLAGVIRFSLGTAGFMSPTPRLVIFPVIGFALFLWLAISGGGREKP